MAQNELRYYAQQCMDNYYTTYKTDYQFFTLDDFILYLGNTIAATYQDYFDKKRQEFRVEKKDEVVTFDEGMLSVQDVTVQTNGTLFPLYADLDQPIMSFLTDRSNSGLQNIFVIEPRNSYEVERSSLAQLWQLNLIPKVNKIFFSGGSTTINFVNKSDCNIKVVRVYYVPQMHDCALIPQGIANEGIGKTILMMKQMQDNNVVKKSLDNNENKVLQTEIDKTSARA